MNCAHGVRAAHSTDYGGQQKLVVASVRIDDVRASLRCKPQHAGDGRWIILMAKPSVTERHAHLFKLRAQITTGKPTFCRVRGRLQTDYVCAEPAICYPMAYELDQVSL